MHHDFDQTPVDDDEFVHTVLPAEASKRKALPIATGFIDYFPDAIAAVAEVSKRGNDQHNPGQPLHWDRSKSTDEADALMRHFLERGTFDADGIRHSAKVAWRAFSLLQKEIEADRRFSADEQFGAGQTTYIDEDGLSTPFRKAGGPKGADGPGGAGGSTLGRYLPAEEIPGSSF